MPKAQVKGYGMAAWASGSPMVMAAESLRPLKQRSGSQPGQPSPLCMLPGTTPMRPGPDLRTCDATDFRPSLISRFHLRHFPYQSPCFPLSCWDSCPGHDLDAQLEAPKRNSDLSMKLCQTGFGFQILRRLSPATFTGTPCWMTRYKYTKDETLQFKAQ